MAYNAHSIPTVNQSYFTLQTGFNSFSQGVYISVGRVFESGLPFTDPVNVTVSSSEGSYSYSGVIAPFVIYPFYDSLNNIVELTITVQTTTLIDSIVVTPSATGQFIDFNLVGVTVEGFTDVFTATIVNESAVAVSETDVCLCAVDCQYQELVLTDASGTAYKNDQSSFLFDRLSSSNTIDFELWKDGAKVADLNNNTYGTYYSSFAAQALYKGMLIDWLAVSNALGLGLYQFRAQKVIFGESSTFESRLFRVLPYSDDLADGSVVLKSYQSGNIIGNSLDYTDLVSGGWLTQYRIPAWFGDKTPVIELDSYQSSDYSIQQIRDQVRREYTLEARLLPANVASWLTEDAVLSNRLLVTDYNIKNSVIYRELPVKASNFDETRHFAQKPKTSYTIKFTDATPNLIKRNF